MRNLGPHVVGKNKMRQMQTIVVQVVDEMIVECSLVTAKQMTSGTDPLVCLLWPPADRPRGRPGFRQDKSVPWTRVTRSSFNFDLSSTRTTSMLQTRVTRHTLLRVNVGILFNRDNLHIDRLVADVGVVAKFLDG